jgi:hypothetical protein
MAQAGDGLCFALEAFAKLRVAGKMLGKNLIATVRSSRVSRPVDLAHASRPIGARIS